MKHAESGQWREAVQHLLTVQRAEQAEQLVRRRLAANPQEAATYELLCLTLLNQKGRKSEALVVIQQALALNPQSSDAHYFHSIALLRDGQMFAALQSIGEALRLEAFNATYLGYKAVILNARKQPKEALEAAEAGLFYNPGHLECLFQRIRALQHLQQPEAAALTIQQLVRWHPSRALSHLLLGQEEVRQQKPEAAAGHFRESIRLNPREAEARQQLALVLIQLGQQAQLCTDRSAARRYFWEAWQLDSDNTEARRGIEQLAKESVWLKRQIGRLDAWSETIQRPGRKGEIKAVLQLYFLLVPLISVFCLPLILAYAFAAIQWRLHPDIRLLNRGTFTVATVLYTTLAGLVGLALLVGLIGFAVWLQTASDFVVGLLLAALIIGLLLMIRNSQRG